MVEETPWQQALRYANRANPYPFYAELRKTPVSRQPDGTYVVSTYHEIVALLHDPRVSSDLRKRPQPGAPAPPAHTETEPVADPIPGPVVEPSIITSDPPEHDRVRSHLMRHFGPPHSAHFVSDMEPQFHQIVGDLLDGMKGKTRIDVVQEFAYPLPVSVICRVLGVPLEDEPLFHSCIQRFLEGLDLGPEGASEDQQRLKNEGGQAVLDLAIYLAGLIDRYEKEPGPGMLSALLHDDGPYGAMPKSQLVSNAELLLFAGHETTVNLISHSVLTLLRHPEAVEKLRRRPELIITAVEEFLRLESSVQFWPTRTALEDIEIAGTTIPKGSPIYLLYASGNRDPERFTNPDQLDIEREDNEHLGYSQGIHVCFGGPLARLELQVAISEFVRRVENPRLVVDPPPYRRNQIFRGPRQLLVDIDGIRD